MSTPSNPPSVRTFPVNLLLTDRPVLVVGGGRIATRKTRYLLAAEARVGIVAPVVNQELLALARAGLLSIRQAPFDTVVDLAKAHPPVAVFAATADLQANRLVLAACRYLRVPACAVDRQWPDGDFITPATAHLDGLTIAVSSAGRSCTAAKEARDLLTCADGIHGAAWCRGFSALGRSDRHRRRRQRCRAPPA